MSAAPESPGYPAHDGDHDAKVWEAAGMSAPWNRVYRDGIDITDDDPSTWPWPFSAYYARGWRPGLAWRPEWAPTTKEPPNPTQ